MQLAQGHRQVRDRAQIQTQFFLTQKPAKHLSALVYTSRPRNRKITLKETSTPLSSNRDWEQVSVKYFKVIAL